LDEVNYQIEMLKHAMTTKKEPTAEVMQQVKFKSQHTLKKLGEELNLKRLAEKYSN
jgi:hypothetical protein